MRADYDTEANAIGITLRDPRSGDPQAHEDRVHERGGVLLVAGEPAFVEVLYPDLGIDEPLAAAARAHGLDLESLRAAARSALEAPDRVVTLEVAAQASPGAS